MFERYSVVAVKTRDLARARRFWADALGFPVTEEKPGDFFMVNAGGLRLCVDLAAGKRHKPGGSDPVIGLKVTSVKDVLAKLAAFGISPFEGRSASAGGEYAQIKDPDGRTVILTETD